MTLSQLLRNAATVGGFVALALFVLLASPGVRVARAGDATEFERFVAFEQERAASGETCQAQAGQEQRMAAADAMREMQLRAAARMKPGTPGVDLGNGIVMLNNRGYNYGPGALVDPGRLEAELRLQR